MQKLILAAQKSYTNMEKAETWNKVDPRDAQFTALSTQLLEIVKTAQVHATSTTNSGGGGTKPPGNKANSVKEWKYKNVGATTVVDGKTWWWCSKHNSGKGLYVRHPPADHDKWAECCNKCDPADRYKSPAEVNSSSSSSQANATSDPVAETLELGSELKRVLASFGMSDADANAI